MGGWLIFLTESCIFWQLPELNFPYTPSLDYMELLEGKPGRNGGNLCLWIWEETKSELIYFPPLFLHQIRDPSCLAEWPAGITSFFYYTSTLIPPTFFGIVICGLEWTTGHPYLAQHREKKEGHRSVMALFQLIASAHQLSIIHISSFILSSNIALSKLSVRENVKNGTRQRIYRLLMGNGWETSGILPKCHFLCWSRFRSKMGKERRNLHLLEWNYCSHWTSECRAVSDSTERKTKNVKYLIFLTPIWNIEAA